jgi:hypothetical protein
MANEQVMLLAIRLVQPFIRLHMSLLQKLLGGFSESPGSARVIAAT